MSWLYREKGLHSAIAAPPNPPPITCVQAPIGIIQRTFRAALCNELFRHLLHWAMQGTYTHLDPTSAFARSVSALNDDHEVDAIDLSMRAYPHTLITASRSWYPFHYRFRCLLPQRLSRSDRRALYTALHTQISIC